jgi:allantoinase
MSLDLVIRGSRVVASEFFGAASIHIRDGRIVAVAKRDDVPAGVPVYDAGHLAVMPGLVDTHVHINEPGRTEWEGFETATRAAAAGGVTTLVDMPLNSIPATTTAKAFEAKLAAANGKCWVDVGFWGGVVPGNVGELRGLHAAGVLGFKCFLVPSGVDEFPCVTEADLRQALPELKALGDVLIVHAELPKPIEDAGRAAGSASPVRYATFLASRPCAAENEAIELLLRLARETRVRLHVVHLSSAEALPLLRRARAESLPVTAETCPHYLTLSAEEVPDGATQFKCCPPIRERSNQEKLWAALADGTLDMIVSDHSPCPPKMKLLDEGDFSRAWGGISSLQLRLPVIWTAAQQRGYLLPWLVKWLCQKPAGLVGLAGRKGDILPGYDADFVVWSPETSMRVEPEMLHHRHKLTPYAGRVLNGVVAATFLRGQKVYDRGEFEAAPHGAILKRGA